MHEPARPDEAEWVSTIIGDIYDASLDPSLWSHVLELTCAYVEGALGALVVQDATSRSVNYHAVWPTDDYYTGLYKEYSETFIKQNPLLLPATLYLKPGDVTNIVDIMPYDEFLASQLCRDFLGREGFVDVLHAMLDKATNRYSAALLLRHKRHGLVDDETRRRMRLLTPHFQRAVAIGKVIDLNKVEAAALADTLDGLVAAMFLVDAGGRIVHANAAAHAMISEGSLIRARAGKFATVDAEADRALHDIFINADGGDAAVGTKGIAVPLTSRDGERYVTHVLPLTSGTRRRAGVAYSAVAAVFVRRTALELPHPLEIIASTFQLTPAEMRVLMMIVQFGGIPEVAPVLGVSEATVKTHLQRIFAKTDTGRQADLVKLVAGYMSPLA